ncbi:alpha-amylase [Mycoplasmatota bacterium]|nr:alpha-amylase [Mycoplasmatota bacterium]
MAKQTNLDLRLMTFYQVFPRQHTLKQNFAGVVDDLERIKNLGVDILYLLPIHPIGEIARKGSKGSPYAIKDYYEINPEYGTMQDFERLIQKAHQLGMKVMIDIVINHTSKDSVLTKKHPEWFYKNEKGDFANRVGDWSDITDLDYRHHDVWTYMQNMLMFWAKKVDGFRCDVAPMIPLDFWLETRKYINELRPDFIWLTESVHPGFIKYLRDMGFDCHSDSEMYQAFDICYDYDIFEHMENYLKQPRKLNAWIHAIKQQEVIYPKNYIKLRSFENHDQPRLSSRTRDTAHFIQMLAFMFFLKGSPFIYAGMEHQDKKQPSLFDDDFVVWQKEMSVEHVIKKLTHIKKNPLFRDGYFNIEQNKGVVYATYERDNDIIIGIFNLENNLQVMTNLKDDKYKNMMDHTHIEVKNKIIELNDQPIIILTKKDKTL